jgi:3-deoxy-D-manno-octulosonate 8-phosphate phosphatase (KDO 8-P phosphatase)
MPPTDAPDTEVLKAIELLVLDVDGVLTDGKIVLTPQGDEVKSFHAKDGAGMKYWKRTGRKLAIISGRNSPAVARRAKELDVDAVRLGAKNKLPAYLEILAELGVGEAQAAVMGDDLVDLPMMHRCGLALAPADAADEVRAAAAHVTRLPGGCGCVREAIETILRRAGAWEQIMARYAPGQ